MAASRGACSASTPAARPARRSSSGGRGYRWRACTRSRIRARTDGNRSRMACDGCDSAVNSSHRSASGGRRFGSGMRRCGSSTYRPITSRPISFHTISTRWRTIASHTWPAIPLLSLHSRRKRCVWAATICRCWPCTPMRNRCYPCSARPSRRPSAARFARPTAWRRLWRARASVQPAASTSGRNSATWRSSRMGSSSARDCSIPTCP